MNYGVAAGDGMAGTPNWMAPEAMLSTGSFPSDLWSLGATVIEVLTSLRFVRVYAGEEAQDCPGVHGVTTPESPCLFKRS